MNFRIKRFNQDTYTNASFMNYETKNTNLLKALFEIKNYQDNTLSFRYGCKSGICGSCTVRVNGTEKLACKTTLKEDDAIEALKNMKIIKDLVVDVSHETYLLNQIKGHIKNRSNKEIEQKDIKKIDLQSNCILCNACFSSCPVYELNDKFLGPFVLTKALRYTNDNKQANNDFIIDNIQTDGIWDCTLCSACTFVCPQGIDSKADIQQLQNISVIKGLNNPYMQNYNFDFNDDFESFNPNGF